MTQDDLKKRLNAWQVEAHPPGLADTIVRRAIALPQKRTLWHVLQQEIENAFLSWRYGLSYKLACLGVCALMGFAGGLEQNPHTLDIANLAFADHEMGEKL